MCTCCMLHLPNWGSLIFPRWRSFPSVAKQWMAALLHECEVEKQGVDLMGRDSLLLGRILVTLVSQPPHVTHQVRLLLRPLHGALRV